MSASLWYRRVVSHAPGTPLTLDEFRAFERSSESKHEFVDGVVYAMIGGTAAHNRVAANVIVALGIAFRGRRCSVFTSDQRVVNADGTACYPDVSALCGEPVFSDGVQDELLNPGVIFEVLSESSEAYDRGEKFTRYSSSPTLQEYILIDPRRVRIETFTRENDGWKLRRYGQNDTVPIKSVGVELRAADVYENVPGVELPR